MTCRVGSLLKRCVVTLEFKKANINIRFDELARGKVLIVFTLSRATRYVLITTSSVLKHNTNSCPSS